MVQIIENWSVIRGEIISIRKSAVADFDDITIRLISVLNYKNFPNLINPRTGNHITVKARISEKATTILQPGKIIKALARAAASNSYFIKDGTIKIVK